MALNSINTNIAAYFAQANIGKASNSVSSSVARLSSGNRIVRSSDDVAALAAGTSLRTQVTTLRTALLNAAQGGSLLQVADGALGQITDILQRQKAISIQAGSGSLSDIERGFLNQEFQSLATEIDRLVANTKFNQVVLLNGDLSSAAGVVTNTNDSAAAAAATAGAVITLGAGDAANNDEITVNGVTVKFSSSAQGTTAAAGRVSIGATVTDTAANLAAFLNNSTDPRLSNLVFTSAAGVLSANFSGGLMNGAYVVDATVVTGANITAGSAANRTIAAGSADGLGIDRTKAIGTITGSLLANGGSGATTVDSGQAINTRLVEDNAAFVGQFGGDTIGLIEGTVTATDTAVFSLQVGNLTYTTAATDLTNATAVTLTFTGADQFGAPKGGSFTIRVAGVAVSTFDAQSELDSYVNQFNDALSDVSFVQNRDVTSFQEGEIVEIAGVEVANLNGLSANFISDNFSNVKIESIKITAPGVGNTDARFEVVINGETYVSTSGIGNQIGLNEVIGLQSLANPNKSFTLVTGNAGIAGATTTAFDIATQAKADALQAALEDAFGLTDAGAKLSFQIGSAVADNIGVQINSVSTSELYAGATLTVATQVGAQAASTALDVALNNLTAVRSNVGALQSRFNFASASLESTIQNQDAARGVLLDTDVVAEATAYATSQVQLQAGIAVLAQANLLPQNLLKLIG